MQLTQEDLEEFKAIYQKEFDTALTDAEVLELAHAALNLMQVVYRPVPGRTCTSGESTLS